MKVADLLSDLTQLQLADPGAALALVSASSSAAGRTAANGQVSSNRGDPDLKRAKDLLDLHKTVKLAHPDAEPDAALKQARADVDKVLREL